MADTKVMILWVRKGARKPKMQGTATAVCSASKIETFRRMARAGRGRLYLIEGRTATEARYLIDGYRKDQEAFPVRMETDGGKTVALGARAVMAIGGAAEARENWDRRVREQGKVTERQSKALTGDHQEDLLRSMRLDLLFGDGGKGGA